MYGLPDAYGSPLGLTYLQLLARYCAKLDESETYGKGIFPKAMAKQQKNRIEKILGKLAVMVDNKDYKKALVHAKKIRALVDKLEDNEPEWSPSKSILLWMEYADSGDVAELISDLGIKSESSGGKDWSQSDVDEEIARQMGGGYDDDGESLEDAVARAIAAHGGGYNDGGYDQGPAPATTLRRSAWESPYEMANTPYINPMGELIAQPFTTTYSPGAYAPTGGYQYRPPGPSPRRAYQRAYKRAYNRTAGRQAGRQAARGASGGGGGGSFQSSAPRFTSTNRSFTPPPPPGSGSKRQTVQTTARKIQNMGRPRFGADDADHLDDLFGGVVDAAALGALGIDDPMERMDLLGEDDFDVDFDEDGDFDDFEDADFEDADFEDVDFEEEEEFGKVNVFARSLEKRLRGLGRRYERAKHVGDIDGAKKIGLKILALQDSLKRSAEMESYEDPRHVLRDDAFEDYEDMEDLEDEDEDANAAIDAAAQQVVSDRLAAEFAQFRAANSLSGGIPVGLSDPDE